MFGNAQKPYMSEDVLYTAYHTSGQKNETCGLITTGNWDALPSRSVDGVTRPSN